MENGNNKNQKGMAMRAVMAAHSTAAEKDTEAQLNAINKTFIQTITRYRARFSLAFVFCFLKKKGKKKKLSALYSLHPSSAGVVGSPLPSAIQCDIPWVKNLLAKL